MQKFIASLVCVFFSSLNVFSQARSLDFYIDEGIRNSPLLKDLTGQLDETSVDSLLVRASRKPVIESRIQIQYSPYYHNFGYDEVITDGGNYQAVAAISQNIFNRKDLENRLNFLEIQKQSISNSARLTVADLKKSITDQYITSYSDFCDLKFNYSFVDLMHSENELVRQFTEKGIFSQTDYLSLIVETQGQELLVMQLKTQYRKDLSLLNQLCGLTDTVACELVEPKLIAVNQRDTENSLFFRQFVIDSLKLVNARISLQLKYRPKINWFADAGVLSSKPGYVYRHFGYSVGANINFPIYDGKKRDLEERKLTISQNTVSNYRLKYKKQFEQILFQLNDELKETIKTEDQINKQLATANRLAESLKAQLEAGQVKMTDYINALKNCRNINRNLNLVSIRVLQLRNEINYYLAQ